MLVFDIIILLNHVVYVSLLKLCLVPMLQELCKEKRIIPWFLLLLKNHIYISESDSERLGFVLKLRCVCVTRAKVKHVLHFASLDFLRRISANCALSLAHNIYQCSQKMISPVKAY